MSIILSDSMDSPTDSGESIQATKLVALLLDSKSFIISYLTEFPAQRFAYQKVMRKLPRTVAEMRQHTKPLHPGFLDRRYSHLVTELRLVEIEQPANRAQYILDSGPLGKFMNMPTFERWNFTLAVLQELGIEVPEEEVELLDLVEAALDVIGGIISSYFRPDQHRGEPSQES